MKTINWERWFIIAISKTQSVLSFFYTRPDLRKCACITHDRVLVTCERSKGQKLTAEFEMLWWLMKNGSPHRDRGEVEEYIRDIIVRWSL